MTWRNRRNCEYITLQLFCWVFLCYFYFFFLTINLFPQFPYAIYTKSTGLHAQILNVCMFWTFKNTWNSSSSCSTPCRDYRCWFSFHCARRTKVLLPMHWRICMYTRAPETWSYLIIHDNSETPSPPSISSSKTSGLTLLCNFWVCLPTALHLEWLISAVACNSGSHSSAVWSCNAHFQWYFQLNMHNGG